MKILAYGSLTNPNQMPPDAVRLGTAVLHGYRWEMLCFANVFASPGNSFTGILWEVTQEMLDDFDRREGYPNFYDRIEVTVDFQDTQEKTWVYVMRPDSRRTYSSHAPTDHYLDMVKQGYAYDNLRMPEYYG